MTREELRAWLDRAPPREPHNGVARPWRAWWFSVEGEYLGERSARMGPDPVGGHACLCEQCRPATESIQAAVLGAGATNGAEGGQIPGSSAKVKP